MWNPFRRKQVEKPKSKPRISLTPYGPGHMQWQCSSEQGGIVGYGWSPKSAFIYYEVEYDRIFSLLLMRRFSL